MNDVLAFFGRWGFMILLCCAGMVSVAGVAASLRYERLKRRQYVERNFGREISEAEKRQLKREL